MISWLQTRFQKHYQVLFLVLLAVVIVSFVFTIGASPGIGNAERSGARREIFGLPFTTEQDQRDFSEVAQISAYLQTGRPSLGDNQLQDYAFQRAAALSIASSLHLPMPTEAQLADYIQNLPAFAGSNGEYDPTRYANFLDGIKRNPQMSESIIAYVLRDDFRANLVNELVGGPGYVLEAEIKSQQERLQSVWSIAEATLALSDFQPVIEPTDEELETFFQENTFRYEIPERAEVDYLTFASSRLIDSIELKDADVVSYFEANKTRFQPPPPPADPATGEAAEAPAEVQLADVRDQVESEMKLNAARNSAVRIASDFAYALFENGIKPGSEQLNRMIRDADLPLQSAPPFARSETPAGLSWTPQIASEAFKLTPDHWFSDPLTTGNDVILIFYRDRLAPYTPEFESVRAAVTADYLAERKRELFVEKGQELTAGLRAALASGQSFAEAAEAAGLETREWDGFTLRNPPEGIDYNLLSRLDPIPTGGVSDMVVARDKGSILHVISKSLPADGAVEEDTEQMREQIAGLNANVSRSLVYSDMIRDELIRSGLATEP
ncbi:MAG: peptidyl-prolyl cis-trans isomerase [Opitutaceae bacterium]